MEGSRSRNRNKMVRCKVCAKSIRSDVVKRHYRTHKDFVNMSTDEAREELRARHTVALKREEKQQEIEQIAIEEGIPIELCANVESVQSSSPGLSDIDLKDLVLHQTKTYRETVDLGRRLAMILDEGVALEEALSKEYKDALDLHRKQKPQMNLQTTQLRLWQKQLLDKMETSQRHVIWITGGKGNEGKSFFQSYVETLYGYSRVVRLDICNKTGNILFALTRRPLHTTDIFLFNDARSQDNHVNYTVLEYIKDGCATASKYGSQVIKFKTPNIVVVFSNRQPVRAHLSPDRWQEYVITMSGGLESRFNPSW